MVFSIFWWNSQRVEVEIKPFQLLRLPEELQLQIIDCAIPPRIFPATNPAYGSIYTFFDKKSEEYLLPLKLSCRRIYNLIEVSRPVRAVSSHYFRGTTPPPPTIRFRFNFSKDTPRVFDMALPEFRTANGQLALLPVERLVTVSIRMIDTFSGLEDKKLARLQFSRKLDLGCLPQLKEFSFICQVAGREWKIESFERQGPQIDIRRDMLTDKWGLVHTGSFPQAAKACREKGLDRFAQTNIKWKLRADYHDPILLSNGWHKPHPDDHGQWIHELCDPEDLSRPDDMPRWMYENTHDGDFIPYIGLYGYDRTQMSIGGNWAGFRYFEGTGEV
ncbi:hypothetical protein NW762_003953 [Fusarium torreyae]|uniref:Uncharacterized protein n=1 Tax=Fusarium torreyae TaxID=1237075 RepID=A0A9W8S822_9HYPO|nr:hypothetical protein NW762_003953 [Fusarium torreyae]